MIVRFWVQFLLPPNFFLENLPFYKFGVGKNNSLCYAFLIGLMFNNRGPNLPSVVLYLSDLLGLVGFLQRGLRQIECWLNFNSS